jgi:hypothetical protein
MSEIILFSGGTQSCIICTNEVNKYMGEKSSIQIVDVRNISNTPNFVVGVPTLWLRDSGEKYEGCSDIKKKIMSMDKKDPGVDSNIDSLYKSHISLTDVDVNDSSKNDDTIKPSQIEAYLQKREENKVSGFVA